MILASQIHRDGRSFIDTIEYILVLLQITHHFYAELWYTLVFLQITCLSFPMQNCLWVILGRLCFNNQQLKNVKNPSHQNLVRPVSMA